ncbi:MAG: 50S ribosomal protein L5 [Candidatus Andersenbacteria bacterium]
MADTRIAKLYKEKVVPALRKEFGYSNVHQVPRVVRVLVTVGTGRTAKDAKLQEVMVESLRQTTGQQPAIRRAKKSIASFKVKEGQPVGLVVTLRGRRMEQFLEKLINVTLPRVRDFRGVKPDAFDGHGSYSLGLKEQTVFPEIPFDSVEKTHGLEITIQTSATTDREGRALLTGLGMPFGKAKVLAEEEMTKGEDRASLRAYAKAKAAKTAPAAPSAPAA